METIGRTGALGEFLVVLALAISGVVLVSLVAFTPWHPDGASADTSAVVEMHAPGTVDAECVCTG